MPTLRDTRRGKLMSIATLAKAAGVATKTIVDIEHGRTTPRLQTMRVLCDALGVEPGDVEEFRRALDGETKDGPGE